MTFLRLNGWTIPVQRGGEAKPIEVGTFERAWDGTTIQDLNKVKRAWSFTTGLITPAERDALIGLLYGEGDQWQFKSASDDEHLYSAKGVPEEGSANARYRQKTDSAGATVDDHVVSSITPTDALFGTFETDAEPGALTLSPAVTNYLPADVRDCENAPTGFTASSVTLSAETTNYLEGAKALKCIDAGGTNYFVTDASSSLSGSTYYVASFYVYGTAAVDLNVQVDGSVTGYLAGTDFSAISGQWVRIYLVFVTGAAETATITITGTGDAWTSYFDKFQLEEGQVHAGAGANDYGPTTWVDGSDALASAPTYVIDYLENTGVTGSMWIRDYPTNTSLHQTWHALVAARATQTVVWFHRDANLSVLRMAIMIDNSWVHVVASTVTYTWNWQHVAYTITPWDGTSHTVTLFFDGASVRSDPLTTEINLSSTTTYPLHHKIGQGVVATWPRGPIEEVHLLPYAATAEYIAAMAARTARYPVLPRILAQGDLLAISQLDSDLGIEVTGRVTGIDNEPVYDSGTYDNAMCRVSFEIESVEEQ